MCVCLVLSFWIGWEELREIIYIHYHNTIEYLLQNCYGKHFDDDDFKPRVETQRKKTIDWVEIQYNNGDI